MSTPGLVAYVDWTVVIVAAIAAVPATVSAISGILNGRRLKTGNGEHLGQVVTQTRELVAEANQIAVAVAERDCIPHEPCGGTASGPAT